MKSSATGFVCRICGSVDVAAHFIAKEHMFGTGEQFPYARCNNCRCVQIVELPANLSEHYPRDYYSYKVVKNSLKARIRDRLAYFGPSCLFAGQEWYELGARKAIRESSVRRSSAILDLGCGSGELVVSMKDAGFTNVIGADPFIECDIEHPNGAKVLKSEAAAISGPFDLVMMHHALEHVHDQQKLASELARLVSRNGLVVIRIPTAESWAFDHYGIDWSQLDPPRHLYLHSRDSIRLLLEHAGLKVQRIIDDSGTLQIIGSDHIRHTGALSGFGSESSKAVWKRARELNRQGRGDSIAVYARPQGV